jgi:hypothetical protein
MSLYRLNKGTKCDICHRYKVYVQTAVLRLIYKLDDFLLHEWHFEFKALSLAKVKWYVFNALR